MSTGWATTGRGGRPLGVVGSLAGRTDAELLEIFIHECDPDAFEVLVTRHGPRVLGVCQQVLGQSSDVEDAFQATFMLLARKASSIRKPESLGHWLHGVAHRVSVRSRTRTRRRQEVPLQAPRVVAPPIDDELDTRDLQRILHEEIDRLPEVYRLPILLCYLDGQTNTEAARALGCPTGTLKDRLGRARETLKGRLARRGLALSAVLLLYLQPRSASAEPLPKELVRRTVRNAIRRRGLVTLLRPGSKVRLATLTAILVFGLLLTALRGAGPTGWGGKATPVPPPKSLSASAVVPPKDAPSTSCH